MPESRSESERDAELVRLEMTRLIAEHLLENAEWSLLKGDPAAPGDHPLYHEIQRLAAEHGLTWDRSEWPADEENSKTVGEAAVDLLREWDGWMREPGADWDDSFRDVRAAVEALRHAIAAVVDRSGR